MNRRLMNTVVKMTSSAGVPEASSCAAATIEAPANTTSDISIATSGAMPLATMATPVMTPKATMPASTGSAARAPATRSFRAAVLADAGLQLFAALVLAVFADLLAPRQALLAKRLALGRVLRLRAHLLHHAILVLGANLAFAGGARIAVRAFRLRCALFAGLGVLLLRAHRLHQAVAPLGALLALAGLFGLRVRRLHLRHALLAGLRVPGLRAIDVALLRMDAGREERREQQDRSFHGLSFGDGRPKNAQARRV